MLPVLLMSRMKLSLWSILLFLTSLVTANAGAKTYAIVVNEKVYADAGWKKVCDALVKKHAGAVVVTWKSDLDESLAQLRKTHPAYTCFVAPCDQVPPAFVAHVHRLTRQYDDDMYTDTRWGILTGYDSEAALALVKFDQPIVVKKVSSGTEFAMEMVEQGVWYDELVKNKSVKKMDGAKEPAQEKCPTDTTRLIADTLTDWKSDLFITSGHGFKRGWQIGFRYRNGFFQSMDGKLMGKNTKGEVFPIKSDYPRVYLPIGNCLIGCIEDKNAFAIAMMKSAGVKGMIGYTVPTWYGYAGWGMLDYFVEQPGRYTLNEAFLANQHALVHRLETSFPGSMKHTPQPGHTVRQRKKPTESGSALGVKANDAGGLLHDRDVLAYYGDPTLPAKMEKRPGAYTQTLAREGDVYTLTVKGSRGNKSFAPVNTNGSQRGGRPIVQFLPERIGKVDLLEGADLSPVIADDFILVPNPGQGEGFQVKFRVLK